MGKFVTVDSTIGEVYNTPVGHDVLKKLLLQLGLPEQTILNPVVSRMRLNHLTKIMGKKLDAQMLMALLHLVNLETDTPAKGNGKIKRAWWKEAVFYQIYPRTFRDTNGDNVGDLNGITEKLDYLKDLGVDALWLSPVYDSPNDDNGYDIRDYRKIMQEFGTMRDFDRLLNEAHKREIKIIMDLVVNHTSDEHEWFQNALNDANSKYSDYYFFRDKGASGGFLPNNWTSFFSGSAWNEYDEQGVYALHLFSKKQMDLNWDNPEVRAEVVDIIKFWLEKGVDGFRMDVMNYISKEEGLPDGNEAIGELFGFTGIEHYMYGPRLHEYLHEIREKAFAPYDAFAVGEAAGLGMEMAKLVTGEERREMDMIFSFDGLENPGKERFDDYKYDLNYYRDYISDWMEHYGNNCWMSLFYNNHDNPRMVSKVNPNPAYRQRIQTLLAAIQLTLKGTPFIYQGDEMGLVNYDFKSIDEITDIESRNLYRELVNDGMTEEDAFAKILAGSREHARVLLPWDDRTDVVAEHLRQTPDDAIYNVYHDLIALRKAHPTLIYGKFRVMNDDRNHFTYARYDKSETFVIDCNLSAHRLPSVFRRDDFEPVFTPAYLENGADVLSPYEVRIWKKI